MIVCTAAFVSATQDIALDAYRIELHAEKDLAAGIATYVLGYRIALIVAGAGALYLAEFISLECSFYYYVSRFFNRAININIFYLTIIVIQDSSDRDNQLILSNFLLWIKKSCFRPLYRIFTKTIMGMDLNICIAIYKLGDALSWKYDHGLFYARYWFLKNSNC